MLEEVVLDNFRCFDKHRVPLRARSIVIGRNNAGKSTLVEALRLVSIVSGRIQSLTFREPPSWTGLGRGEVGVAPSIKGLEFSIQNLFHRYGDPPGQITAKFQSGVVFTIHVGPEAALHVTIHNARGRLVRGASSELRASIPRVEIMPQVAPLAREETILMSDYVRRNLSSSLASSHFRNQLNLLSEHFDSFAELAAETWPGLKVQELVGAGGRPKLGLELLVRDGSFVAEVAAMGHGLQMWLQTMWFLARVPAGATVILDEPDVYMHPDLQRRLVRHLKDRFPQIVVTTHSVEIVSEVAPDEILIIDRNKGGSQFADSIPSVQSVIERVGSVHNLQLVRLWQARKCVLVEGYDFNLLADFYDVLFPADTEGLLSIPNISIGGWGGWSYAIGSSIFLKNAGDERIQVHCVLDSDYHTEKQITGRKAQAKAHGVALHIWAAKELENYVLVPTAIKRLIDLKKPSAMRDATSDEIEERIDEIAKGLEHETFDGMASERLAEDRSLGSGGANKAAREALVERWSTPLSRRMVVSGKQVVSTLSGWCQKEFGVSLSSPAIVRMMRPTEVDPEVAGVLNAIVKGIRI